MPNLANKCEILEGRGAAALGPVVNSQKSVSRDWQIHKYIMEADSGSSRYLWIRSDTSRRIRFRVVPKGCTDRHGLNAGQAAQDNTICLGEELQRCFFYSLRAPEIHARPNAARRVCSSTCKHWHMHAYPTRVLANPRGPTSDKVSTQGAGRCHKAPHGPSRLHEPT